MVGPMVGPTMAPRPNKAVAVPTCSGGHVSNKIDCAVDISPPPAIPWSTRKPISSLRLPELPHKKEAMVNKMIEAKKYSFLPKKLPNQPDMGKMITLATL